MENKKLIEKVITEWSWRCEKGYPDLNNPEDIKVFREIFDLDLEEEVLTTDSKKSFDYLKEDYRKAVRNIAEEVGVPEKDLRADTKSRAIFLTNMSRPDFFEKLEELGFKQISRNTAAKDDVDYEIQHKPLSKQGIGSAGKLNEQAFNDLINESIEERGEPIDVVFRSGNGKTLKYEGVAKAIDASRSGADKFDKSDTDLLDEHGNKIVGISLKKKNAIRWESSKRRPIKGVNIFESFIEKVGRVNESSEANLFENVMLNPIEGKKKKYKLYSPEKEKTLSKVIIKNVPSEVNSEVVFGDSPEDTIVIKETFEFGYSGKAYRKGALELKVHLLYEDIEDINETVDEPVFALSNHIGQAYGIEFRSFSKVLLYDPKGNLKGTATEIDFKDLL